MDSSSQNSHGADAARLLLLCLCLSLSWAKSTIFINKPVSALLKDAGNIPVDRKNKDNQALFSGTFEVLKLGEAVAIFPEGTSYTEPAMQAIKEGASWAALEYAKNIRSQESPGKSAKDVNVVVASIVYTQKTNYRSRAVMQYVGSAESNAVRISYRTSQIWPTNTHATVHRQFLE